MSSILLELRPEELTRYRTEHDPLGEKRVPDDVLYGIKIRWDEGNGEK